MQVLFPLLSTLLTSSIIPITLASPLNNASTNSTPISKPLDRDYFESIITTGLATLHTRGYSPSTNFLTKTILAAAPLGATATRPEDLTAYTIRLVNLAAQVSVIATKGETPLNPYNQPGWQISGPSDLPATRVVPPLWDFEVEIARPGMLSLREAMVKVDEMRAGREGGEGEQDPSPRGWARVAMTVPPLEAGGDAGLFFVFWTRIGRAWIIDAREGGTHGLHVGALRDMLGVSGTGEGDLGAGSRGSVIGGLNDTFAGFATS